MGRRYTTLADLDTDWLATNTEPGPGGCLLWRGRVHPVRGLGRARIGGRETTARRASWQIRHGPVPAGQAIVTTCGRRDCVAPDHLEPRPADSPAVAPRRAAPTQPPTTSPERPPTADTDGLSHTIQAMPHREREALAATLIRIATQPERHPHARRPLGAIADELLATHRPSRR